MEINYTYKDFHTLKQELIKHAQTYFPNAYGDFSEGSPGMMLFELAAFVGDVTSFNQDLLLQETFVQYAQNPTSLYNLAYMMGYRPKPIKPTQVELLISQNVDVVKEGGLYKVANVSNLSSIPAGTVAQGYVFLEDFEFTFGTYKLTNVSQDGGTYKGTVEKRVVVFKGVIKEIADIKAEQKSYYTYTIPDQNVVKVLKLWDSSNSYHEVNYLGEDTVYNLQKGVLQTQSTPWRYITRYNTDNRLYVQFGGLENNLNLESNLNEKVQLDNKLNHPEQLTEQNKIFDNNGVLSKESYGKVPETLFNLKYFVADFSDNTPTYADTVTTFTSSGDSTNTVDNLNATLTITNPKLSILGTTSINIENFKEDIKNNFNAQSRLVTEHDFNQEILNMPTRYGHVHKVYTQVNNKVIRIYVLTLDSNKNLLPPSISLLNNIKTYISGKTVLNQKIHLYPVFVVNFGIKYEISIKPGENATSVLLLCSSFIEKYFLRSKFNINSPIKFSSLKSNLDGVPGVMEVKHMEVFNITGSGYSEVAYDIPSATKNRTVYPSYDPCCFELRYPEKDIEGKVVPD